MAEPATMAIICGDRMRMSDLTNEMDELVRSLNGRSPNSGDGRVPESYFVSIWHSSNDGVWKWSGLTPLTRRKVS